MKLEIQARSFNSKFVNNTCMQHWKAFYLPRTTTCHSLWISKDVSHRCKKPRSFISDKIEKRFCGSSEFGSNPNETKKKFICCSWCCTEENGFHVCHFIAFWERLQYTQLLETLFDMPRTTLSLRLSKIESPWPLWSSGSYFCRTDDLGWILLYMCIILMELNSSGRVVLPMILYQTNTIKFLRKFTIINKYCFFSRNILDSVDVNKFGSRYTIFSGSTGYNMTNMRTNSLLDFFNQYNLTAHRNCK